MTCSQVFLDSASLSGLFIWDRTEGSTSCSTPDLRLFAGEPSSELQRSNMRLEPSAPEWKRRSSRYESHVYSTCVLSTRVVSRVSFCSSCDRGAKRGTKTLVTRGHPTSSVWTLSVDLLHRFGIECFSHACISPRWVVAQLPSPSHAYCFALIPRVNLAGFKRQCGLEEGFSCASISRSDSCERWEAEALVSDLRRDHRGRTTNCL